MVGRSATAGERVLMGLEVEQEAKTTLASTASAKNEPLDALPLTTTS